MDNAENPRVHHPQHDRKQDVNVPHVNGERDTLPLSGTADGVWDRDCRSNELYLSPSWKEILGYDQDELENDSNAFTDLLHPDDRDTAIEAARAHLEEHVPYDVNIRLRQRNGDYKWVQSKGQAVWDKAGKPIRMAGSIRDISDRRHAEEELAASRQRFQEIAEIGSDWMWEMDSDQRITWISVPKNSSLGPPHEVSVGITLKELGAPDGEIESWKRHLDELRAHRPFRDFSVRRKFSDGKKRHLLISANPIFASDGEFQGYRGIGRDITAQVEAERKIATLEKRFVGAIDNMSERVALFDADERLVFCNEAYRFGTDEAAGHIGPGVSFEEILRARVAHDDQPQYAVGREDQWIAERLERFRNPPNTFEFRHRDKWLRARDERLPDGGTIQIISDVTQIRQREEALCESEARLAEAQRIAHVGSWVSDHVAGEIRFSDELNRILGIDPETFEYTAENFMKLVHPDDHERVMASRRKMVAGKGDGDIVYRIIRPDGIVRYIHSVTKVFFDEDGKVLRVAGIRQDVTDRVLAEKALGESEKRYRLLVELVPEPVFIECDGTIVFANRALAAVIGVDSADQLVGREVASFLHPDSWSAVLKRRAEIVQKGVGAEFEERRYIRLDGTEAIIEAAAAPFTWYGQQATLIVARDITARKQAENALRISEANLSAAQRISGIGSWESDLQTGLIRYSEEFCRILEVDPEFGKPSYQEFIERVHPDDRERVRGANIHSLKTGEPTDHQYRIVYADGAVRHVHSLSEVHMDESGNPDRIIGALQDITERVRADEALRESEERYRQLIELTPEAVFVQRDGANIFANVAAAEILGAESPESLKGLKTSDYIHPDCLATVHERHEQLADTDRSLPFKEFKYVRLDGTEIAVESAIAPMSWHGGPAILVVARDITERKQAEKALRESEARFRSLIENSPYEIALKDIDGRFVVVNASMCRGLGKTAEDMIGKTVYDFFPQELADEYAGHDRDILENRKVIKEVFVRSTVDGARHDFVIKFPILDRYENPVGIGFMATDITERKMLEEQLAHAQKLEAVGQLTGGVAHEFNNLLAVILGNADLLRTRVEDDKGLIQKIMRAANRGAELTYQLLAYSRRQPLRARITDAGSLVDGMLDMLQRTLGATVAIKTVSGRDLWKVETDSGQLEVSLLNLAVNARDAMPKGGSLTIETANVTFDETNAAGDVEALPGDYVLLGVTDTGEGMTPDVLKHAVDPFFTTKDVGEGTGLGLSMVYGFAKQSGGFVEIDTEVGHGTTVRLYLPRMAEQAGDAASKDRAPETAERRGETVLVVEDDPSVRELVMALVSNLGYTAIEAADGETAMARFEQHPDIDLLFTDIVLPRGISGLDIARELQSRRPGLPVIFTSGYPDIEFDDLSVGDYRPKLIAKPFTRSELAESFAEVLKPDKHRRQ